MEKKLMWAHDYTGILHPALVFTAGQMLSRTLGGLYFCAT